MQRVRRIFQEKEITMSQPPPEMCRLFSALIASQSESFSFEEIEQHNFKIDPKFFDPTTNEVDSFPSLFLPCSEQKLGLYSLDWNDENTRKCALAFERNVQRTDFNHGIELSRGTRLGFLASHLLAVAYIYKFKRETRDGNKVSESISKISKWREFRADRTQNPFIPSFGGPTWDILGVFIKSNKLPHGKVVMVNECEVKEGSILKYELLTLLSFTIECYELQNLQPITIIPIILFSFTFPYNLRIIVAYFDNRLRRLEVRISQNYPVRSPAPTATQNTCGVEETIPEEKTYSLFLRWLLADIGAADLEELL